MYHKFFTDSVDIKAVEEKAKSGDAIAQYELGIACYVGNGIEPNAEKAVEWLTKAVSGGVIDAYAVLGDIYADPSLNMYDMQKSVAWHKRGIEHGSHDSLMELTMIFMNEFEQSHSEESIKCLKYLLDEAKRLEETEIARDIEFLLNI